MRVLSLGGGVQSTALMLLANEGKVAPKPDLALFSDTGWEPQYVYDNVERLAKECSFPLVRVFSGNIREQSIETKDEGRYVSLPMFAANGRKGMLPRQCTMDYKVTPIRKYLKEQFLKTNKGRIPEGWASVWIGISYDEIQRMKDANVKWIDHRWPLIEKQMSRMDCIDYLKSVGWGEVKKSSCVGCPFHDNKAWAEMKRDHPEYFKDAVEFDKSMRHIGNLKAEAYLHRDRKPLDQVDFGPTEDGVNQMTFGDDWGCDSGFCHV